MTFRSLVWRNLTWYWRTNLAVVLGVAVAVSVLTGSLLVGDSVRSSLRRMAVERLGRADVAIVGTHFFRELLAIDLLERGAGDGESVGAAVPLIALDALAVEPSSGRRAGGVHLFGVDDRFWRFHGAPNVSGPSGRDAYVSPVLAGELELSDGDTLLLRVQQPSAIPASVLQGRRDDLTRTLRTSVARTLPREQLGEFSLSSGQGPVRAVFVPLDLVQRDLGQPDRANVMLVAGNGGHSADLVPMVERTVSRVVGPDDLAVAVKPLEQSHALSVESRAGFLDNGVRALVERASAELGLRPVPVLTYIANTIGIGERTVPYSVVTALDGANVAALPTPPTLKSSLPPIWLNEWAVRELKASVGDIVLLEYFRWSDHEGLTTHRAEFAFSGGVPMSGLGGDRTLTPEYPGMTGAAQMGDWDPPFPIDLARIHPRDEQYWDEYRTAPKAFVRYADGRPLWGSRFGDVTSLRLFVSPDESLDRAREEVLSRIHRSLSSSSAGLAVQPVRAHALAAAQGSTDFGEYFVYFSFFLFVAGLILAALFFRLGVEQRTSEIGLLHALGYTPRVVRRIFLGEGAVLAVVGCVLGVPGGIAFCSVILTGLRTWWIGAVGTDRIVLDVEPTSLVIGAAAGLATALLTTFFSVGALGRSTARALLAGGVLGQPLGRPRTRLAGLPYAVWIGIMALAAGVFLGMAITGTASPAAAFFGAGAVLLVAGVLTFSATLRRANRAVIRRPGLWGVLRLGARQTSWRPGRSVLATAIIAAATFVIVAVGAFRGEDTIDVRSPQSGTGGFSLFAESLIAVMNDPGTPAGREALGFGTDDERLLADVPIARFRLRPGDEASCLNLYRPTNPRIVAPEERFRREPRFTFAQSLASTDAERVNPWLLLDRRFEDGAVPAIGDATSLAYALHRKVGEDLTIAGADGRPIVLRIVAALADSVFQSELLIAEPHFLQLFPREEGYRFFLIDAAPARQAEVAALMEDRMADLGFDIQGTVERIEAYHRVERTYLSTFQTLGGFGLILGTLGLGAVLLRNVLERRRELALLRVVGYRPGHLRGMILAESMLLLGAGVLGGSVAAVIAVAPALWERGGGPSWIDTVVLLGCVVAAGVLASILAARAATRSALLAALRSE